MWPWVLLVALVAGGAVHLLERRRRTRLARAEAAARTEARAELEQHATEESRTIGQALAQLTTRPIELVDEKVVDERYVIIGRLGAGGAATVYEVERISDGRRLAMKMMRDRADPRRTARFAREARLAAELPHPNLLPVLDVGMADGSTYVVTPLVDGGSLLAHQSRFGDRAWAEWMLSQIAAGLAALHEHGIVHGDLRAANVLVSAGQARIADAGIIALAPDRTRGEGVTGAVDVLAFGILARELFGAGPLPEIVARCLADDPEARPSAGDLQAAFAPRTT